MATEKISRLSSQIYSYLQGLEDNICQTIDLGWEGIEDLGVEHISMALGKNTSAKTIYLHGNKIGDDGATSLAEALKINKAVVTLDLKCNKIGDKGAEALAEALGNNSSIASLNLSENMIGGIGAQKLAEALRMNTSLKTINLLENNIGDQGAEFFARALETNKSLTTVILARNDISDKGAGVLIKALENNKCIMTMDLGREEDNIEIQRVLSEGLKTMEKDLDIVHEELLSSQKIPKGNKDTIHKLVIAVREIVAKIRLEKHKNLTCNVATEAMSSQAELNNVVRELVEKCRAEEQNMNIVMESLIDFQQKFDLFEKKIASLLQQIALIKETK